MNSALFSLSSGGCQTTDPGTESPTHFFSSPSPDEIHCYQDEIDAELQNARPKLRGVYAAYAKEGKEHAATLRIPFTSTLLTLGDLTRTSYDDLQTVPVLFIITIE